MLYYYIYCISYTATGREKDIILLSTVRSNRHHAMGFVSDERRLNVAITRAKRNCIVIGDICTLGDIYIERRKSINTTATTTTKGTNTSTNTNTNTSIQQHPSYNTHKKHSVWRALILNVIDRKLVFPCMASDDNTINTNNTSYPSNNTNMEKSFHPYPQEVLTTITSGMT